jgi:hypothetical protein
MVERSKIDVLLRQQLGCVKAIRLWLKAVGDVKVIDCGKAACLGSYNKM